MSWAVATAKRVSRYVVCAILEAQVKRLRKRHAFTVIAVAGSIGKTSTKVAIAETLGASRSVRYQKGNYNDRVTVPLVLFGHNLPALFNIVAWVKIFLANNTIISQPYPYDYVIVELGTDRPGQMAAFDYLQPDITVVTAVVPEHMAYFGTLNAVAAEEFSVFNYSKKVLVNTDDTPVEYLKNKRFLSYSLNKNADYYAQSWQQIELKNGDMTIALPRGATLPASLKIVGKQGAKITLAAAATAHVAGLTNKEIVGGLANITPFAGRMQILEGICNSIIIDDTYNASPPAVEAALDVLYAVKAPQRIAILGRMNQMGDYSPKAHREVGAYCDAKKLDLVVTIGDDAEAYLAPAAQKAGCTVKSFSSPRAAGNFVASQLKKGGVVLAEGSQDGVYAEEALKPLLKNRGDVNKLVRQSARWMATKRRQFPEL